MIPVGGLAAIEAVVCVGGVETPYRRVGHGPPVLLLSRRPEPEDAALLALMGPEFRVIAPARLPAPAAEGETWARWLRDVIDGLGLDRTVIVAEPEVAARLAGPAAADPDRMRTVVPRPDAGPALLDALRAVLQD